MLPSFLQTCAKRRLSKYSPLTPRIRLLMLLPSPWHKMFFNVILPHVQQVTSTSYQSDGVLSYEKLWYLFYRYLRVSLGAMQKCMLHNSVKYRNICSRDPITLLSMDIMVETFLGIDTLDLLVSTLRLQDPLYGSMRNILILKYWARKAKHHNISQYLIDNGSFYSDSHRTSHICVYQSVILSS
jgi:hypothetical protein